MVPSNKETGLSTWLMLPFFDDNHCREKKGELISQLKKNGAFLHDGTFLLAN